MRLPSRLRRSRHGVYYFRVIIPKKLRSLFSGRRECLSSLATRDPREAAQRSYALSASVLALFREIRNQMGDNKKKDLHDLFKNARTYKIKLNKSGGIEEIETDPNNPADHRSALEAVDKLLASYDKPAAQQPVSTPQVAAPSDSISLKKAVERYLRIRKDRWHSKTYAEYQAVLNRFCEVVGSCALGNVTQRTIEKYLEAQVKNELTARTRDKHVDVIRGFFNEAIESELFSGRNPALKARVLTFKQTKELRGTQSFTSADLQTLFARDKYPDQKGSPHEFWFPFLGLFTGARIGELAQLALSDIVEIDGIPSFDINDDDYKGLKNKDSRRKIPIHPELIRIGFLGFVDDMRALAKREREVFADDKDKLARLVRLFPYLTAETHGGFGGVPSEAFGRHTRKVGVHVHRKKVFHSFRFTANDLLKHRDVPEEQRCAMVGHAYSSVNSNTYGTKFKVDFLLEKVVPHLTYDELDLSSYRYERGTFDQFIQKSLRRKPRRNAKKKLPIV